MPTILVVDDDPMMRLLVQTALKYAGHTALTADDGYAALALLATTRPDLIFIDVMMPRMNGIELVERLNASPVLQDIPIIMMSAASNPRLSSNTAPLAFLQKPFVLNTLTRLIDDALKPSPGAQSTP
ncbi:MAG: hypothetical protein NVS4B8_27970 [Herpetosiphon sp.]